MKRVLAMAIALMAGLAFAQYDASDGYVQLKKSDQYWGTKVSSWNQVGNWDLTEFTASTNYYVPSGREIWAGNTSAGAIAKWAGGPLVFAGGLLPRISNGGVPGLPQIDDVTFLDNSYLYEIMNVGGLKDSAVTIKAAAATPFKVRSKTDVDNSYSGSIYFPRTTFSGEADTGIRFSVDDGKKPAKFYLDACNFENYDGTVTAYGSDLTVEPRGAVSSIPAGGGLAFKGAFVVDGATVNAAVSAANWTSYPTMPVGSLTLRNGATVKLWQKDREVHPVINVANSMTMDGTSKLSLGNFDWSMFNVATAEANSTNRLRIAHIADGATIEGLPTEGVIADLWQNANASSLTRNWRYEIVDCAEGGKDVFATYTNNVVGTLKNDTRDTSGAATAFGCDNPSEYWSDGQMPSPESTSDYLLRYRFYPMVDINLPKASVTVIYDNSLDCIGDGNLFRIRELNLVEASTFGRWSGDASKKIVRFEGGVINLIGSNAQSFQVSHGRAFHFFSRFTGTKTLSLSNRSAVTDENNMAGEISLSADNSDFHGRLILANMTPTDVADSKRFSTYIGDVKHWGGAYSGSADPAQAIELRNDLIVYATNDVAFAETDRSICMTNGVRLSVSSGKTFTLGNQLTVFGRILKLGAGTLGLSGTLVLPETEDGASLQVSAGALKVGSATACDGLDVSFDAGTKLIVRSDIGYVNTTAAAPLTINTADGKLPVVIEYVGEENPTSVSVTVATVGKTAGESLTTDDFSISLLKDGQPMRGMRRPGSFTKVENADSYSFVATYEHQGCILILR